jgi:hypothetical protein
MPFPPALSPAQQAGAALPPADALRALEVRQQQQQLALHQQQQQRIAHQVCTPGVHQQQQHVAHQVCTPGLHQQQQQRVAHRVCTSQHARRWGSLRRCLSGQGAARLSGTRHRWPTIVAVAWQARFALHAPYAASRPPPEAFHGANRRRFGSAYMDAEEIDTILRIQWKSLHSGCPYVEDYYYQARAANSVAHQTACPSELAPASPSHQGIGAPGYGR